MVDTLKLDEKISIINLLENLAMKEAELMWIRYATMLYASTGLVGILSFALKEDIYFIVVGCSLIGILFSIVWINILRISKFYYDRWQTDADKLIKDGDVLEDSIRGRINPRVSRPVKWDASKYAIFIPRAFLIVWILVCF